MGGQNVITLVFTLKKKKKKKKIIFKALMNGKFFILQSNPEPTIKERQK